MYTCNICGKNFVTNYILKRHTLQVHEKNAVLQCADCSKKFVRESDLKRHRDSVHSTEKITCKFCYTSFTRKDNLLKHLNNKRCERKLEKEAGKRKRVDLSVSSRKKKTQLSTSAENSTADPENIFLPPKENESAFQKAYKTFNLPYNDSSMGIKGFLLLRKEETIFIFRNELETYKALKVSKWVHCIYSKATHTGKMIKNVEFKTPNNEVLQETNLARLYDNMSEKIVKESEDFEGRDSGWTLDKILRLEVRMNRYSPFRGSSTFIEVPKQIAETKAIINVINKKHFQCFMWSILAALYPNPSNSNKTSSYVPHLNKLNFDGISFPTPLNEEKTMQLAPSTRKPKPLQEKTTQLSRRKQLNSSAEMKQLNSAMPSTACNHLYSRIGFFYLLMFLVNSSSYFSLPIIRSLSVAMVIDLSNAKLNSVAKTNKSSRRPLP
ncbi:c2H2-type domain-containing protein [Trichonephila clavipes]|nr:c2H2-type domain-containing protein [Trichonephila clavipes]